MTLRNAAGIPCVPRDRVAQTRALLTAALGPPLTDWWLGNPDEHGRRRSLGRHDLWTCPACHVGNATLTLDGRLWCSDCPALPDEILAAADLRRAQDQDADLWQHIALEARDVAQAAVAELQRRDRLDAPTGLREAA